MKDGSGNPPDFSSGDYSEQPDAAVTQRKLGHAQKKSLLKMSKGIVYFMFTRKLFVFFFVFVFFFHRVFIIRI
jgi:hypothetical protein